MSDARSSTVRTIAARNARVFPRPTTETGLPMRISVYFGMNTFDQEKMKARVPPEIFSRWKETIDLGRPLEKAVADAIAHAVKEWAISHGATHFCHWFHPMTGSTAEKHDSFLCFDKTGRAIEHFTGSMLLQSEPDASSFPSGGMRSTFEARGYTAWDPTSPMFLMDNSGGKTLCIPSAFIGYHGQALDEKAPLLRSMEALNRAACRLAGLLGIKDVHRVHPTVGAEQEYFLIDQGYVSLRPDLNICGRTVVGATAPKGQSLEDHYFGSIPSRVKAFMEEVEVELYKLAVPCKTRHNEVAPNQFELAPIFTEANIAADHNQLVMSIFKTVGQRHNFNVLFHEKPFAGVNGSGKHINWSMQDNHGTNYLEPGDNPASNLRFLAFLAATLIGVHRHAGVLRSAIASYGNDFRLGANEAPPAIISVFMGDLLTKICEGMAAGQVDHMPVPQAMLELGVDRLPRIIKDNTDRNRTSSFAFTGNKFEFRAVGSSASISFPTTCLNTAIADGISTLCEYIQADSSPDAIMNAVRKAFQETAPVRFDGNGYSQEWAIEAARRGLPIARDTPSALKFLAAESSQAVFKRQGVLTEEEVLSRYEVRLDQFNKKMEIEGQVMLELVDTMIIPAAIEDLESTARASAALASLSSKPNSAVSTRLEKLQTVLSSLQQTKMEFEDAFKNAPHGSEEQRAEYNASTLRPIFFQLREYCDQLERVVSDTKWPLPKYREMFFQD